MKKILITGKNSYVGTSLEKWLVKYPESYSVEFISLRDDSWKSKDFSGYDVVFHAVGIAHIKETQENITLYYNVNRDLTYEFAKKAKNEGVKQFIFLSSMSVYGIESGVINKDTLIKPKSNYGKSKKEAEELILSLENDHFSVVILRPPMIYGKGCKGNFIKLRKLALKIPIFPNIQNQRSMIYIDNLSIFVKCLIDNSERGIYFPQNNEYICTSKMVDYIARVHNKHIYLTKVFNPLLKIINKNNTINKVFGNLTYDKKLSIYKKIDANEFIDFNESIILTEE